MLWEGVRGIERGIEEYRAGFGGDGGAAFERIVPDVEVLVKAVRWALEDGQFHAEGEVGAARELLEMAGDRLAALRRGEAPWLRQAGLVIRGYRSRIDGSVQPYGLVVPSDYQFDGGMPARLDVWCHGRGEKLTELAFLDQRRSQVGEIAPQGAIVLHPYGRYCNANKFAGEVDLFEALDHAASDYRIDPDRLVIRGFSMGGAACWQFAVHYADRWVAANPGAGFSETPEFLRFFQDEDVSGAPWYEKRLWHWYNATDWARNLAHCPTVAYSGEIDRQKQAADAMAAAMEREGMRLVHVVGPGTAHSIHPDSKREIEDRVSALAGIGRDPMPRTVRFTTYTLRYPGMHWVRIDGLGEHWDRADIDARIDDNRTVRVATSNVTAFTLTMAPGRCPLEPVGAPSVVIDGSGIDGVPPVASDRSWTAAFHRGPEDGAWRPGPPPGPGPRKRPGLQGPIDDAFMEPFVFVRPGGRAAHPAVEAWVRSEMDRAVREWRRQFRGDVRVIGDAELGDAEIAGCNLVLWGDPTGNAILARILGELPVRWSDGELAVAGETFAAEAHVPVLVFPNPLNPERYVVVNSGFTYREYDYLNNARQVPKLPDWAVVDLRQAPDSRTPGRIAAAGFFDEAWRIRVR